MLFSDFLNLLGLCFSDAIISFMLVFNLSSISMFCKLAFFSITKKLIIIIIIKFFKLYIVFLTSNAFFNNAIEKNKTRE